MSALRERIRAWAHSVGFDGCRFTSAAPPPHGDAFRAWLREGRQGTMAYLERTADRRLDPGLVLPGARTVIALAVSYHAPSVEGPSCGGGGSRREGVVARYARHRDYHDLMAPRLSALIEALVREGGEGTRAVACCDAGPFLERDLAQRAGLGFAGKHTNLIGRNLGNWFFLAEILTTLEVEPDEPERNRCGSCTRCLAACPTQAITAPFELDARRCISYLTIELKGAIPLEFRSAIGTRIFGCDDCLEACPWNRFAREGRMMAAARLSTADAKPDLVDLLALDDAGFKRRFAGTPMMRAKRRGLLRNVCVALGNLGDASARPALAKAAADPEPLVAEHAAWALERLEGH